MMAPVSVCHHVSTIGQLPATDVLPVPDPRLGVDGLADAAEQSQRREVVALGELRPPLHERADGGGRDVEDGHAVALDHVPQAVLARVVGRALVEHAGAPVHEGPVDDVGVAGHPADVGRAPVDVGVGLQVEHVPVRPRDLGEVAPGRVHDALGAGRGAAGVQQVEEVLAVHRLGRAVGRLLRHEVVPPDVATVRHLDVVAGALQHQDLLDRGTLRDRGVGGLLQRHDAAAPPGAVTGDEHLGSGVLDAVAQRVGREPAEHHRVRGADAGAREQRHRQLRHHPQVDVDPVALLHAEGLERVGELRDVVRAGRRR